MTGSQGSGGTVKGEKGEVGRERGGGGREVRRGDRFKRVQMVIIGNISK